MKTVVDEISIAMWDEDFWGFYDDGRIEDLSNPLSVVMLIIAFDTEVMMNGMINFLGNSTGRYATETIVALQRIGCRSEASCLEEIVEIASDAGMTHEEIQSDLEELPENTIASFRQVHGDKWDDACKAISEVEKRMNTVKIRPALEPFAEEHEELLRQYLDGSI